MCVCVLLGGFFFIRRVDNKNGEGFVKITFLNPSCCQLYLTNTTVFEVTIMFQVHLFSWKLLNYSYTNLFTYFTFAFHPFEICAVMCMFQDIKSEYFLNMEDIRN